MKRRQFLKRSRWVLLAAVVGMVVAAAVVALARGPVVIWLRERPYRTALPSPLPVKLLPAAPPSPEGARPAVPAAVSSPVAQSVNLDVPFAPQAPYANWDQPYQDACEEAAIIMVERSLSGASLSLAEMDQEILRMVDWQVQRYGFYKDSNTAETARLAREYYPHLAAEVAYDITADDIRAQLQRGQPVAVLVDGRKLGNPFYTQPGPDRHALVIKGMTGSKFITNDPGTKRGKDFVYDAEVLMQSVVDYDGHEPGTGKRAMIILTAR